MKSISVTCLQNRRKKALYCVLDRKKKINVAIIARKDNQLRRKRRGERLPHMGEIMSKPNNFIVIQYDII